MQTTPSPAPTPSASPGHRFRLRVSGEDSISVIDQNYVGSGLMQQENGSFIAGLPFAPGMPYDFFSAAPTASGFGFGENIKLTLTYGPAAVDYGITLGFGSVVGSAQTVGYWGEQPIPPLNPHLGQTAYQLPIAFPTKPGLDDVSAVRGSVLGAFVQSKDGNYALRAGWFDLRQTQKFVFTQATVTNSSPALAVVPPNSVGPGAPTLDDWLPSNTQLPLSGVDVFAKVGEFSLEGATAALPAPAGVGARLNTASIFWQRERGPKFALQYASIATGGDPVSTTTFFGVPIVGAAGTPASPCGLPAGFSPPANPVLQPFPGIITNTSGTLTTTSNFGQGPVPFTCLAGQQNQIWGLSASGKLLAFLDGIAELGYSQYRTHLGANGVGVGAYLHGGLTEHLGALTLSQHYYSVDPRYAPTILPYGNCCNPPFTTENIWSAAYTWPAQWLRGDYQSIDNTQAYNNRRGFVFGASFESALIQVRLKYSVLSQLYPVTLTTAAEPGFVEGYYLPELVTTGGNLGIDRLFAAWIGFHPKPLDISLDYATQNNYRPGGVSPGALGVLDTVAMSYPQMSVTLSKRLGARFLLAGGFSDYLLRGTWAGSGVNLNQAVPFLGFQLYQSAGLQLTAQARYYNTQGVPPLSDTVAPTLKGLQLLFEQKARI